MRRSPSRAGASRPSRRRSGCKTRVASIERGPLFGAGRCAFGAAIIGDLSGTFSDAGTSSLVRLSLHVVSCMPLLVLVPHMPFRACRPSRVALLVRHLRSLALLPQVKKPSSFAAVLCPFCRARRASAISPRARGASSLAFSALVHNSITRARSARARFACVC